MAPKEERVPAPFIVGTSRSGTTLLRLMLDAHPHLAIPSETHFIPATAAACAEAADPHSAFIGVLCSHPMWSDQHVDAAELARRVAAIEPFHLGDAVRTFYTLYAEMFRKPRWGDKTPPYLLQMDLIESLLPEAHFVHMIRDGRDVALSVKSLWFGPDSLEEAAHWWVSRVRQARAQSTRLAHYLEVRYEDLVLETEDTLGRVCDFIGLSWDPAILAYHRHAGERLGEMDRGIVARDSVTVIDPHERQAIHSLAQRPPQGSRVGRWRTELTPAERERFLKIAGGLLEELGYGLA